MNSELLFASPAMGKGPLLTATHGIGVGRAYGPGGLPKLGLVVSESERERMGALGDTVGGSD